MKSLAILIVLLGMSIELSAQTPVTGTFVPSSCQQTVKTKPSVASPVVVSEVCMGQIHGIPQLDKVVAFIYSDDRIDICKVNKVVSKSSAVKQGVYQNSLSIEFAGWLNGQGLLLPTNPHKEKIQISATTEIRGSDSSLLSYAGATPRNISVSTKDFPTLNLDSK